MLDKITKTLYKDSFLINPLKFAIFFWYFIVNTMSHIHRSFILILFESVKSIISKKNKSDKHLFNFLMFLSFACGFAFYLYFVCAVNFFLNRQIISNCFIFKEITYLKNDIKKRLILFNFSYLRSITIGLVRSNKLNVYPLSYSVK